MWVCMGTLDVCEIVCLSCIPTNLFNNSKMFTGTNLWDILWLAHICPRFLGSLACTLRGRVLIMLLLILD